MYLLLAFFAGACISIQASMNAIIGTSLKSSMYSTTIAFSVSSLICAITLLIFRSEIPAAESFKSIPIFYWFSGAFSAIGVGLFYLLIPKIGVDKMMSWALTGQLIIAVVIAHYGWFNAQVSIFNSDKALGIVLMGIGIAMINR